MKRYQRQIDLAEIGNVGQQKLADSKVLVIGAGGLGCSVLQSLVAAGVGTIGVVDGDIVEETNLNRQFLYNSATCGENKAIAAAEVLSRQNSDVKVIPFSSHFTDENAFEIVSDFQIIVDCTDNIQTRYLINDVALVKGMPMVCASIHHFEGQLSVFNYQNGPTYRCLFPDREQLDQITCEEAGVLGVIPNLLGVMQANEVLKIILQIGEVLSGKLLLFDGLRSSMQKISIQKNAIEIQNGLVQGLAIRQQTKRKDLKSIDEYNLLLAIEDSSNLIIDIREDFEEPTANHPNIHRIPIDQLENYLEKVNKDREIILLCHYGHKSQLAANYIIKNGFTNISHLHNGISGLSPSNLDTILHEHR